MPAETVQPSSPFWNTAMLFGILGAFLGEISRLTVADLDMFHQMALFRAFLDNGSFPAEDIFSYVQTVSPLVHHEWGFGAILYLILVSAGLGSTGLMAFKYILSALICLECYAYVRHRKVSVSVFAPLSLIAIGLGWIGFSTIRAQLFSLLLLTILIHLLERDRNGERAWIFVWLPIFVLWINVHAGFLVGVGLIIFHTLERALREAIHKKSIFKAVMKVKHIVILGVAMCFLILLNPYGLDYVTYLFRAVALDRSTLITEWRPLWQSGQPVTILVLFFLSIGILGYSFIHTRYKNLAEVFFLFATAWLAFWHIRYLSIYSLAWICYVPRYLEDASLGKALKGLADNRRNLYFAFWVTIGVVSTLYAISNKFWSLRIPTTVAEYKREGVPIYPVGAVRFLADHGFRGNVMVPFEAGSYVSWKLYPNVKVSMDSRFEAAYPMEVVVENIRFYSAAENWEETVYKYPTDAVLVPGWSPLEKIGGEPWIITGNGKTLTFKKIYKDDGYTLFVRSNCADSMPFIDNRKTSLRSPFP